MLDKRRIRNAFDRAAPGFDVADFLHTDIRNRLLSRLEILQIQPEHILDLGAGTGAASAHLVARYPESRIFAIDHSAQMLAAGRQTNQSGHPVNAICADSARLPIKSASIDLVFSNLMLHHCPDLTAALTEARRTLRFPGLLTFTTFGPDSFIELRNAWAEADGHDHVFEFIDMHHVGDALIQAGFAEPVVDAETLTITYADLPRLMTDLRGVGSINAMEKRNAGLTGRKTWQRMSDAYDGFRDAQERLPVTLEIVYGLGWSGPSGPRSISPDDDIEIAVENLLRGSDNRG